MELEEENEEVLQQIAYGVEYLAKEAYNLEDIRKTKLISLDEPAKKSYFVAKMPYLGKENEFLEKTSLWK